MSRNRPRAAGSGCATPKARPATSRSIRSGVSETRIFTDVRGDPAPMNIAVLGAGAWGTALAVSLAGRHRVALWARNAALAAAIRSGRRNSSYLPEVPVPDAVTVTEELSSALAGSDLILIATPTSGLREVLEHVRDSPSDPPVVWACKGLEQASGKLPHQVVAEVLGKRTACGALSGPSFALEVAQGRPTALTLAARDAGFAKRVA